jgi:alpha-glucosidase
MTAAVWWKRGVIYQIYPRSFQDTNSDGIGDLEGIRRRLDYLVWLGIDAIWISPIFPSPMADFGYDVADYCGIDPIFGSLDDFDRLIAEAHEKGLKVILDFVPNHTSSEHPWFVESRSDRGNAKRDWYIWRDPKPDGAPPNNWISHFGGPAWELDEKTGQYYLHSFLREQPDLNWRNGDVRKAMYDALRFWLKRGVDGFRVDVIWLLIKDEALRDNPPNPGYQPEQAEIHRYLQVHSADQPEVHGVITEMRRTLDEFDDRVLIGEIYLPLERLVAYYGQDLSGAHLPFNFQLLSTAWNARDIARLIEEYEAALPAGGWPNWVLGNHDQKRIAARVGEEQARIAAMLLLTLRGTPTMYYGDELGIGAVEIPQESIRDSWALNEPGLGLGRDPARTPMQWDGRANAGFSETVPWLPLAETAANVDALKADERSMLTLYRRLLEIRRQYAALEIGAYQPLGAEHDVLFYRRSLETQEIIVALNFSAEERTLVLPPSVPGLKMLISTHLDRDETAPDLSLRPHEGIVALIYPESDRPPA